MDKLENEPIFRNRNIPQNYDNGRWLNAAKERKGIENDKAENQALFFFSPSPLLMIVM